MANICTTDLRIYGDGENFSRLVSDFDELFSCTNSAESPWIGKLFEKNNLPTDNKDLRAWVSFYDHEEAHRGGSFSLLIESKWTPPYDFFAMIEEEYEGVGVSFMAEELGCGIYETNDMELFSCNRFQVYDHEEGETEYFSCREDADEWIASRSLSEDDYSIHELEEVNIYGTAV